jgi:hypothetical protein
MESYDVPLMRRRRRNISDIGDTPGEDGPAGRLAQGVRLGML